MDRSKACWKGIPTSAQPPEEEKPYLVSPKNTGPCLLEPKHFVPAAALELHQNQGQKLQSCSEQQQEDTLHVPPPLRVRHGQDSQLAYSGIPGEQGKRLGWPDRAVVSATLLAFQTLCRLRRVSSALTRYARSLLAGRAGAGKEAPFSLCVTLSSRLQRCIHTEGLAGMLIYATGKAAEAP